MSNTSARTEVAYDGLMQEMVFEPGCLIPEELIRGLRAVPDSIQPVGTMVDLLKRKPDAGVQMVRRGGLGDVCMLLPALRELQRRFPKAQFEVESRFESLFAADPSLRRRQVPTDYRILLDRYLELDHTGDPAFSHVSRVDLYGRAFSMKLDPPVSWELPLTQDDETLATELVQTSARTTLALQLKGHAPHRSLGPKLAVPLIEALRREYRIVVLDDDKGFGPTGDGILNTSGKLTVRQAIAVLKRCDVALTMESGVFWLAHIAKIPTVCFFGPTRPTERLWHHPLHPNGILAVVLNELLSPVCPPCWGNGFACDAWGRKVARCMNEPDPTTVVGLVTEALRAVQ